MAKTKLDRALDEMKRTYGENHFVTDFCESVRYQLKALQSEVKALRNERGGKVGG